MTIGELEESRICAYEDLERACWAADRDDLHIRRSELPTLYIAEEALPILLNKLDVTLEQVRARCNIVSEDGFVTISPILDERDDQTI